MLTFEMKNGGKLDLPATAILMLEELEGKEKGCSIIFSYGQKNELERLSDTYGFVKKKWLDSYPEFASQALEVTIADEVKNRKLTIPKDAIIGMRELKDSPVGAKLSLMLNINGAIFPINVVDERDTLVGD